MPPETEPVQPEEPQTEWRSSSFGGIVEVGPINMDGEELIAVRGPGPNKEEQVLIFTRRELWAFLEGAKAGEFDDLA